MRFLGKRSDKSGPKPFHNRTVIETYSVVFDPNFRVIRSLSDLDSEPAALGFRPSMLQ